MSRNCCVALSRGAVGLSAVFGLCFCFPDHTHLLFLKASEYDMIKIPQSQSTDQQMAPQDRDKEP